MTASIEWTALFLTLQLAAITTLFLFLLGIPLAWWLAQTRTPLKPFIEASVALPLVLPPTVIGFYLLVLLNPDAFAGALWISLTGESLTFSFNGLVAASIIYSLPFMVQPVQSAFETAAREPAELAATLGHAPFKVFTRIALPAARRGLLTGGVLSFAHTLGEFGVVLMIGGNIPGETRVVSVAIYEHVETLNYAAAHSLSALLLGISFIILICVYLFNRQGALRVG